MKEQAQQNSNSSLDIIYIMTTPKSFDAFSLLLFSVVMVSGLGIVWIFFTLGFIWSWLGFPPPLRHTIHSELFVLSANIKVTPNLSQKLFP